MAYMVFDCRKGTGILFETRRKWLAHAFCVFMARVCGQGYWDYDNTMCFDADQAQWEADYRG